MIAHNLAITEVSIHDLRPHPQNAHAGDVEAIKRSIARNGIYAPLFVQRSTDYIIKGNHTYFALLDLGFDRVPVVHLDVTDAQAKAIMLADNRTSALGREDEALVYDLLRELAETDDGLTGIGYEESDLKRLENLIETPLEIQLEESTASPQAVENLGVMAYEITPIVDDLDGRTYQFEVTKRGERPLSGSDLNRIRKALGGRPLSKADLAAQGVPAWVPREQR